MECWEIRVDSLELKTQAYVALQLLVECEVSDDFGIGQAGLFLSKHIIMYIHTMYFSKSLVTVQC